MQPIVSCWSSFCSFFAILLLLLFACRFRTVRPRLHEYVFISFSSKPQTFLLRFHLASTRKRQKTMIVFTEDDKFRKRSPKWKDLKTQWYRCHVDGSFLLKMQAFENDATTATYYSNYLDTQTTDFRWFLPFLYRFHLFRTCRQLKSIRKRCVDAIQSLRFHWKRYR